MTKNMRKRAGSIALATALTVTMLPQGSLVQASEAADEVAINVDATNLNASETRFEGESGQSGLNYTLVNKNGTVSGECSTYFSPSDDAAKKYDGNDLGCVYTKEATTFKVWSPTASKVTLCRYTKGTADETGSKLIEEKDMTKDSNNVWSCKVDGDIVNTYYTYKVTNNNNTSEVVDIYAKAVGANGKRAMVVDLDSTDPDNWDTDYKRTPQRISDVITWEVHVNDFSNQGSKAGFSDEHKGKYLAFTEDGTKLSGTDYETGIAYLKKLGITHVQIMPMYDYGSVNETKAGQTDSNYNWGYDPVNYNAPEGSYSTNPYDGNVRINEMKQMIQALHDAGIKVIMDVVYNHTYCKDGQEMAFFDDIVPGYYYRSDSKGYTNGSGCGNEVRTQAYMANKFIRESMLYWASEYNLDGFRLDLMGLYDTTTMKDIRSDMDAAFGKDNIVIYGEGWGCMVEPSYGAGKWNSWTLADSNIGLFNDSGRDCIHGTANADHVNQIGMLQQNISSGTGTERDKYPLSLYGMLQGAAGKSQDRYWMWRAYCFKNSDQSVSYSSCHDNMALWDKLAETIKDNGTLVKLNKMNAGILFSCHGGTFIQAGEEFGRSKDGIENSYSSGARVNQLDWTRVKDYNEIVEFYKGMIAIRKAFSGFRTVYTAASETLPANNTTGGFQTVGNNNMTEVEGFNDCSNSVIRKIGFYLNNNVSGEWNKIAVLMNNETSDAKATLSGASSWVLVSNGKEASVEGVETVNGNQIKVPGKSVVVAVPKDTFDANPNPGQKNTAPTITVDNTELSVAPGESVSFTVTAKDADGDKVTLSAAGLPEGAEFDAATGKFTWDSAKKGGYTITVSATDGTATTKKEIKINVVSATASLDKLINDVEKAGFSQKELTDTVWQALKDTLDAAKELAEDASANDAQCAVVKAALQKAFDNAKGEKTARENLQKYVTEAEATIAAAKEDNNDAELLKDAKNVLQDAKDLLKGVVATKIYTVAQNNLEDSVASLAIGDGKPSIHVSAPEFDTPYVYAWTGEGTTAEKLLGEWPGTQLKDKDADGNYVCDIEVDGKFNVIINNGKTAKQQTKDLTGLSGKVTIALEKTSSGTDANGNAIYTATAKSEEAGSSTPELFKTSLEKAISVAKAYDAANYTDDSFAKLQDALDAAQKKMDDQKATQLEVNKATRTLRAAYVALEPVSEDIVDPTEPPKETSTPTPEITATPEGTPDADEGTPEPKPEGTETPVETAKPTDTPDIPGVTNTPVETAKPTSTPVVTKAPTATENVVATNTPAPAPTGTSAAISTDQTSAASASELAITSLTVSPALSQVVKKPIKVSARAEKATGTANFKFEVYRGTLLVTSQDYSESNTYTFKVSEAGSYTVKVTATDDSKKEVVISKKVIVVSKALSMKLKAKIAKKKNVKVSAIATGGLKSYKFKYTIKNTKGKTVKRTGYVSNKTLSWKSGLAGKYTVQVIVKDATGTRVQKKLTFKLK